MDLSIVIPTLNEAAYIVKTVDEIYKKRSEQLSMEIILIDAGSADQTVSKVKDKVDIILEDDSFRGAKYKSLNKGGELAKGDAILFLDADSLVPPNFDLNIRDGLKKTEILGGAFEFQMDGNGLIYRIIEWINRIRYRIDHKYFGDQGIFCTKKVFSQLNGYPEQPIMEAAYFCRKLRGQGKLVLLHSCLLTSSRRFQRGNVLRVLLLDTWIWIQFSLGLSIRRYARSYWLENEQRS
ncbi:MAG: glycosyltransferase family 2 protein [Reichenbachiella sp.]|uniref:TIGR04283 family arsenosugar biosynthesis glycosyltransferase n=1 Tax=Reichenbachiella sp. TaxID=2184521 RepID=UPI00326335DC